MRSLRILPLGLGAALLLCGVCRARHDGGYLREVTTRLETPHLDWATPYAQGKPRVLFIVPRTMAPREIVELWQRFDLDFTAFTLAHAGLMSFESDAEAAPYDLAVEGTSIAEKTEELLGKLERRYDAVVMANASLDSLPKEAQYGILKQVSEGAGLLFTFGRATALPILTKPLSDERDTITAGVPLAGLGYFRQERIRSALGVASASDLAAHVVETFRFGRGRIAVLQYGEGSASYYGGQSLTPAARYDVNWQADYEILLSLVYRTLLWSLSTHKPVVRFVHLPAEPLSYARAELPARLALTIAADRPLRGRLTVIVRDRTNLIESQEETALQLTPGTATAQVRVPRVKAGEHFLDLLVRSDAGTEQWGSLLLTVSSPFGLAAFGTQSEFVEKDQAATLSASLTAPAPAGAQLVVTLTDSNDRLYSRRELSLDPGTTTIAPLPLDLSGATAIYTRLRGELRVGAEPVDARDAALFVPRRQSTLFRSVIWGVGGDSGLTHTALRQLRAAGFTEHLSHPTPSGAAERLMAMADLPLVCYAYRIMGHADERGWRKDDWLKDVDDACFYNPELQEKARNVVLERIRNVIPYGPSLYSLGDENYFDSKAGLSPWGVRSFRAMLQAKYTDIGTLNRLWGTGFQSFDEVSPRPPAEALKEGQWPLLHEQLGFCESEYADYHHFLRQEIRKADPGAWVGAEGSEPGDLEKTIAGMEIWGPYADTRGNGLLRSLSSPARVRGNWWGGYVGSHGARAGAGILWHQLLAGTVNTSLFFAATGAEGLFATDLSYAEYFERMLPDLREIYGGTGQLLSASRVADDGLAIHYSQAGEHAATMFAGTGTPVASQGNLQGLLERNGLGYRFVTTAMVESGALLAGGFRVLFLACSLALSDAEVAQIRAFAEAGGTVIADVGTGCFNGACRPLWRAGSGDLPEWRGQLDELLGLRRQGPPAAKAASGSVTFRLAQATLKLTDFPFRADRSVVAESPTRLEGTPLFLVRAAGKGTVVFLNFPLPNPEHPDGVAFLRDLLGALGVSATTYLSDSKGYACRRFENGALTLVGVSREAETAPDTTLRLATPAQVYDVRAGRRLGHVDRVELPRTAPAHRLFALLPERAAAPQVTAATSAVRGQASVLRIALPQPGADPAGRVLRVQAFRPDGAEAMPCRTYLVLQKAEATASQPWALNDPPGKWTVQVTDVATGLAGTVRVRVK